MRHELMILFVRRRACSRRRTMMMAYLSYHYSAYLYKTPKRSSILTGDLWMREMIEGNHESFVESFRMPRETFCRLVDELVNRGGLRETAEISCREMLGIFLYFAGITLQVPTFNSDSNTQVKLSPVT